MEREFPSIIPKRELGPDARKAEVIVLAERRAERAVPGSLLRISRDGWDEV
jgi:hypothetical protein